MNTEKIKERVNSVKKQIIQDASKYLYNLDIPYITHPDRESQMFVELVAILADSHRRNMELILEFDNINNVDNGIIDVELKLETHPFYTKKSTFLSGSLCSSCMFDAKIDVNGLFQIAKYGDDFDPEEGIANDTLDDVILENHLQRYIEIEAAKNIAIKLNKRYSSFDDFDNLKVHFHDKIIHIVKLGLR
jgi:Opacity protein and related surface antigens